MTFTLRSVKRLRRRTTLFRVRLLRMVALLNRRTLSFSRVYLSFSRGRIIGILPRAPRVRLKSSLISRMRSRRLDSRLFPYIPPRRNYTSVAPGPAITSSASVSTTSKKALISAVSTPAFVTIGPTVVPTNVFNATT